MDLLGLGLGLWWGTVIIFLANLHHYFCKRCAWFVCLKIPINAFCSTDIHLVNKIERL